MGMKFAFYDVNLDYIAYLKQYETEQRGFTRVPNVQYASGNNKFFLGVVLNVNGLDYFVPISSKVHKKQDDLIIRIKDREKPIAGTLRFAYMIPVHPKLVKPIDFDSILDPVRKERTRKEYEFCKSTQSTRGKMSNKTRIFHMAKSAYDRITSRISAALTHSSCDFKILEVGYLKFCHERDIQLPSDSVKTVLLRNTFNSSRYTLADFFPESEIQFAAITPEQAEMLTRRHDLLHVIRQGKQSPILQYHKSDAAVVQAQLELIASQGATLK